jgi:2-polyprenyl-3-methyl-5-hydroxy-6-metoxy-1,4-benzoquinol methylase
MVTARQNVEWETLDCPVCGGDRFASLFEKHGEPFVQCLDCRLVLINPRPVFNEVRKTYDPGYSQAYIRKADKKLKRCRRWVGRIAKRFVSSGRWLDVGCSAGFVVAAAEQAGFEAYGVELEPAAVAYGRKQLGLDNLRCGTLVDQRYADAFFDVITLYDVIEHVPDLNGVVAELARILKPGGVVEIRTPDAGHWRTPNDLSDWPEVKPSEHLYYFSHKTLARLFTRHGLCVRHRRIMLKTALDVVFGHASPIG